MSYYFLVASLPAVSMDAPPPMSTAGLHDLCSRHLSEQHNRALHELARGNTSPTCASHPFVGAWHERETALRAAAAHYRAGKAGVDAAPFLQQLGSVQATVELAVHEAYSRPSPVERERVLDRCRWTMLDDLAGLDPFAVEVVFAYAVKLGIAERWACFNSAAGLDRINDTVDALVAPHRARWG